MAIWNVCIALSTMFLLLSFYYFFLDKKSNLNKILILFVLMGFFVYYPSYLTEYSILNATFANIINLLQIVTVNSDNFVALQESIPIGPIFHVCMFLRGITHIAIPILAVYAAFSVIVYYWDRFRFQFFSYGKKNIYIFTCLNEKIESMIRDIYEKDHKSMFIIFENNKMLESISYMSQINLTQNLSATNILQKIKQKNLYFFCFREDTNQNIVDGLKLVRSCSEVDENEQKHIHIYIFSETSELDELMLDAIGKKYLDVRIIDRYRSIMYQLLRKQPLYQVLESSEKDLSVLIIGLSKLGLEAFKTVLWCGQLKGVALKINVILQSEEQCMLDMMRLECPEIFSEEYAIDFHVVNIDSEQFIHTLQDKCASSNYIIVSRESDALNLKTAVFLRRFYYKLDNRYQMKPFIAAYIDTKEIRNAISALHEYEIYSFGDDETLYTYEELISSSIEQFAQNVHFAYAEMFSETGKIDVQREELNYKKYEVQKRSNLAAALHIQYKLWQLGYELIECIGDLDDLKHTLTTIDLEPFAEIEHNRWMAFHRVEGWSTVQIDDAEKDGYKKISHKGKSALLKMHQDICPYYEIEERSKCFGRDDTRELDTALIKAIPDILTNKWSENSENIKTYGVKRRNYNESGTR